MKLIFKGRYNGSIDDFTDRINVKNAVKYEEAENTEELTKLLKKPQNILGFLLLFITVFISTKYISNALILLLSFFGSYILSLLFLIPHELLHAICFKGKVYLYYNTKPLMMFVVGEDYMSKFHFIFLSLLPNIVLGFIPFIVFLIKPILCWVGFISVFNIVAGIGDYYNVYNTIMQVPKGAKIFMKGESTYFYMPKNEA